MPNVPMLEKIREELKTRQIQAFALVCGVHPNTLYRLRAGKIQNPEWETMEKIKAALWG
jgi:predicted transcriptional regulator